MIGVIDVGGGVRGAYGAGVLDYCLHEGIQFDYGIGVSAGSANIVSYLAEQEGRNFVFYTDYFKRDEYMGLKNMIKTHNYIGLDYIYGILSNADGEYPLDFETAKQSNRKMVIVTTDAITGKPHYFDLHDMENNNYDAIKASCCVPVANRPYMIHDVPYYDGGISDPIPFKKAFADGCDKLVIILTRPKDYRRIAKNDAVFARLLEKKYPNAADDMLHRSEVYNAQLDEAIKLEEQGEVCIVAPDSIGHMRTLSKDKEAIANLYAKGRIDGKQIKDFLQK